MIILLGHIFQISQNIFIKEANHLQGLQLILFNLSRQVCLFPAQVLSLWTMILIERMLLLLIQLLIDLILLLAHGQNPNAVIILINNWLTYSVILQTHLLLIKPLVLILIQGELKLTSLILLVALSLTSSIISYFNVIFISILILCNSI